MATNASDVTRPAVLANKNIYYLIRKNVAKWAQHCGSAFAIVALPTVGTLRSGQQKLSTFWRGIPAKQNMLTCRSDKAESVLIFLHVESFEDDDHLASEALSDNDRRLANLRFRFRP